jgi:integrase
MDCFGEDRRISTITSHDLWSFIEGVQRFRRTYHTAPGLSFVSRQTDAKEGRITAVTVTGILARCKSLFRWARKHEFCATNPAEVLSVTQPKQKKGQRSRRPFKALELKQLFSSPLFTGCRAASRRFEPGVVVVRDAYYWLPLLGFFTGARLGELVQLGFDDFEVDGPTPHISINEDGGTDAEIKHVKTDAGVRLVPLHPELLALGFGEFVKHRLKVRGKRQRLFWEIAYGADGQASSTFSKWWGRAMDKMGLDDPALTFHSFRHTAEDFFKTSLTPKYIIDQIIGHSDQTAAGDYGVGVDIVTTSEVVNGLKLPLSLLDLWQVNRNGEGAL